jgi:uncharacterized membrane protein
LSLGSERSRSLIAILLVAFIVVIAVFLWFVDLISYQRAFGSLLSAVLVAFSMLVYTYTPKDYSEIKKSWLLAGELTLFALLLLAIIVSR